MNSLREADADDRSEDEELPHVRKDSQSGSSTSSEFVRVPLESGDDIVLNSEAQISISSRCCECENRRINGSEEDSSDQEDDLIIADDVETADEDASLLDDINSINHETTLDASTIVAEGFLFFFCLNMYKLGLEMNFLDERASFAATPSLFNDDLPQNFVQKCSDRMRNYMHAYNPHLNWRLTLFVALSCTAVMGLGIGHFMGHSARHWIRFGLRPATNLQELRYQALRDQLGSCEISKETLKVRI